jgi:hypothetical protein
VDVRPQRAKEGLGLEVSEEETCDNCGATGRRRRGTIAPENWLFLEAINEDTGIVSVVLACKPRCALELWRQGPGKLDLTNPDEGTQKDTTAAPAFCGFPPIGDNLPERLDMLELGLAFGLEPDGDGLITRERLLEFAASLRAP